MLSQMMPNMELEKVGEQPPAELEFSVRERLRRIRETCGLSQRALAKRTGVANGLISMIELGRTSPSVATLKKILEGVPRTLAEFFSTYPIARDDKIVYRADELSELGSEGIKYFTNVCTRAPIPASSFTATMPKKVESSFGDGSSSPSVGRPSSSAPATPTTSTAAFRTASAISETTSAKS